MPEAPLYDPSRATYDAATEQRIAALLKGAIDPHVHSGPSIALRALDHLDLARDASAAGFAAIVTKDHDYAGVMTAWMIGRHHPELTTQVYSSIVLNNVIGGFNPYAVEHSAAMGGKICFMPTLSAANHFRWEKASGVVHPGKSSRIRPATPVLATHDDGSLRDEVREILDVLARTGMALASGHLHISETWTLFEEARRRGVTAMILTHPEDIVDANLSDVTGLAALGAYVEHSLCMFVEGSKFRTRTDADLKQQIDAAGVDRTIFCSDFGQVGTLHPIEGFRRAIKICIDQGYADDDIRKMVSTNAARALGLKVALPAG